MDNPHENLVNQICSNCKTGYLEIPPDEHPSYCLCNTCGAIHLTYEPMDHQMEFHSVPYEYNKDGTIKTQTFGLFGGRKFRSLQLKNKSQSQGKSKG